MVPVCLPWKSNDPGRNLNVGKRTTVTGWGRVHNNNFINRQQLSRQGVAHEILQKANLPIAKSEDCSEKFIDFNNRTQICAGGEKGKKMLPFIILSNKCISFVSGVDSCKGDSGGPLTYRKNSDEPWFQVGLVSYGKSVCGVDSPGVYTKISSFVPWIEANMKT